ncbi:sialate O-acetylesterase [Heyndrickxia ginsengihumi]|uniref:sialate O-acetylesterase n=1 Tax=Heyndrickxia ginsengihumi TaxID=363870 RepID=UPI003D1A6827
MKTLNKVANIFSDGMVLQRHQEVPVFGTGADGTHIRVKFAEKEYTTIVKNGNWCVWMDPQEGGIRSDLIITYGSEQEVIHSVQIGDVYLLAGQSNIEFKLSEDRDFCQEKESMNNMDVYYYNVPKIIYEDEQAQVPREIQKNKWEKLSSENCGDVSAVGFYFVKQLVSYMNHVPIGLVSMNKGGTSASCWQSIDALKSDFEVYATYVLPHKEAVKDQTDEEEERLLQQFEEKVEKYLQTRKEFVRTHPQLSIAEVKEIIGHTPWPPPKTRKGLLRPAGLFETMLKKIIPFSIRGIIWYQGEEDAQYHQVYDKLLYNLIKEWRKLFYQEQLPFYVIQLPAYDEAEKDAWAFLREQQRMVTSKEPFSFFITTFDTGEAHAIHPASKNIIGTRAANLVLSHSYKKDEKGYAPEMKTIEVNDHEVIITYKYVKTWSVKGKPVCTLVDTKGNKVERRINVANNQQLRINIEESTSYISYCFENFPHPTIFNEEHLPIPAFKMNIREQCRST